MMLYKVILVLVLFTSHNLCYGAKLSKGRSSKEKTSKAKSSKEKSSKERSSRERSPYGNPLDAPYASVDLILTAEIRACPSEHVITTTAHVIHLSLRTFNLGDYCGNSDDCSMGHPIITCQSPAFIMVRRKRSLNSDIKATVRLFGKVASRLKKVVSKLVIKMKSGVVRACPTIWRYCKVEGSDPRAACLVLQDIDSAVTRDMHGIVEKSCFGPLDCHEKLGDVFSVPEGPRDIKPDLRLLRKSSTKPACLITKKNQVHELFDKTKKTIFIVHGYSSSAFEDDQLKVWYREMIKELFLYDQNLNVVVVDWRQGAQMRFLAIYSQAAANSAVMGAGLGYVTKHYLGIGGDKLHCIGHSLGAHICGFSGKWMSKNGLRLGRISALDVAGPEKSNLDFSSFHTLGARWRLDKTDADFVDVIHTSAFKRFGSVSLGFSKPIGHVDFYPNGGHDQPQCIGALSSICDHRSSRDYLISSIRKCAYTDVSLCGLTAIKKKACDQSIQSPPGMKMGYHAIKPDSDESATYYVQTAKNKPYCGIKQPGGASSRALSTNCSVYTLVVVYPIFKWFF